MTIEEMKRAAVELSEFCRYRVRCTRCPFGVPEPKSMGLYRCRLSDEPADWDVEDWSDED